MRKEDNLSLQISKYLQLQYPKVLFHFDLASGGKMSIGMAVRNKKMNPCRGFPDLFIAQPNKCYHGLFIELKTESPYLKDGKTLKHNEHLLEQKAIINRLLGNGYYAEFVIGFDEAKIVIDVYMAGR